MHTFSHCHATKAAALLELALLIWSQVGVEGCVAAADGLQALERGKPEFCVCII